MSNSAIKKNKAKILRIKTRLTIGGPDTHVFILNSGIDRSRFSSYLITGTVSEGEYDATNIARKMGIKPIVVIPELRRDTSARNDISAFFKLCGIIKRLKPDIVHTHTAKAGTLGRMAAILNRVPVRLHTFHGHVFHSYFGKAKTRAIIMIERFLARFTSRIIVISQSQLKDVKDIYRIAGPDKISLIPLGLDLKPFLDNKSEGDLRKEMSVSSDTLLVAMVGRLVEVKNHKLFLDAVRIVKEKSPRINVKYVVVGDGALRRELESYAQEIDVADRVIFLGWRRDLDTIYKSADLVCLTSLNEGTPISLIEAMAAGKAVIGTDVGGVRDVVSHGASGLLSPSKDAVAFSRNLTELLLNKEKRDEMGRFGREHVAEKYSKERLISDVEKLYDTELERARAK